MSSTLVYSIMPFWRALATLLLPCSYVVPGSAAAACGNVHVGDLIVEIDQKNVKEHGMVRARLAARQNSDGSDLHGDAGSGS